MQTALSRRNRWRATLALVALYAFCVLMPAAALAMSNVAAHCLTEPHGGAHVHQAAAKPHVHADGAAHTHDDHAAHADDGVARQQDADGKSHGNNCCGLFCVTAIAQGTPLTLTAPVAHERTVPALEDALAGRGPDRINRPPIG